MWLESRKRNRALKNIRDTMMSFGYDISELSDQDIEDVLMKFYKIIKSFGITVKEAARNLSLHQS